MVVPDRMPERGACFTAHVQVYATDAAHIKCEYRNRPKIGGEIPEIALEQYLNDLREFPRTPHWMPDWLRERMDG